LPEIVVDFSDTNTLNPIIGDSYQCYYVFDYLKEMGAKTCVIENRYIDKDYLVDYQKFYSRAYDAPDRFTIRLHFFKEKITSQRFDKMLEKNDINRLQKSYLGFLIIKPIYDKNGCKLLGRTLLKTYPNDEEGYNRYYITQPYTASLFGIKFGIDGIPFQAQDNGVSACATIALWTTLQIINPLLKIPERSPAEITELSAEHISEARIFPQEGLTLSQMIKCIRSLVLDIEVISAADSDVVVSAVKAFTAAGIPLIAALKLSNKKRTEYHAAVIVGYKTDQSGDISEFYVHDDQIGPYSKVIPRQNLGFGLKTVKDFRFWENEWAESFSTIQLEKLLVPIYHKIRLPWHAIYKLHMEYKKANDKQERNDLFLFTVQKYKNEILNKTVRKKIEFLQNPLPRFIWVERIYKNNEPQVDQIFDATAIHLKDVGSIEYIHP
jgi:hypothetical protein